jgi:hypothetical protein
MAICGRLVNPAPSGMPKRGLWSARRSNLPSGVSLFVDLAFWGLRWKVALGISAAKKQANLEKLFHV